MLRVASEKQCAHQYSNFTYRMRRREKKQPCVSQEIWEPKCGVQSTIDELQLYWDVLRGEKRKVYALESQAPHHYAHSVVVADPPTSSDSLTPSAVVAYPDSCSSSSAFSITCRTSHQHCNNCFLHYSAPADTVAPCTETS
ncbi:hypothetical protein JCGZ_26560 [Jatropha curcas]|uniref:Uncharacterized protein n=1 Tax=Jatropha curcas TaxID=180498 RepID=A0A067LFV5_JATCU|nr:hypothetical protein JCGZ_26560 [Jatropha curcas]